MQLHETMGYCPMCGEASHAVLTDDEWNNYMQYYMYKNKPIQELLPTAPLDLREFLRSDEDNRYCGHCQELLFGRKASGRIKETEGGLLELLDGYEFENLEEYDKLFEEAMALMKTRDDFSYVIPTYEWNEHTLEKHYDKLTESEHFILANRKEAKAI